MPQPKNPLPANDIMKEIHELHDEKRNCTLERRAKFWAKLGGKDFELTPDNFHVALAQWLHNAGIIDKDRIKDAAAALYCLGVTNSNNLFQKIQQGKLHDMGISKNGRPNGNGKH
jgi:hypothetical protein